MESNDLHFKTTTNTQKHYHKRRQVKPKQPQASKLSTLISINLLLLGATIDCQPRAAPNASTPMTINAETRAPGFDESLMIQGKCLQKGSCKQRGRRLELDSGQDKRSCYCDEKCLQYDDCCLDSQWSEHFTKRIAGGLTRLRNRREQWHCHRINPVFGDVLLKASCLDDWLAISNRTTAERKLAEQVQSNCEHIRRPQNRASQAQADPVGMMLPITDLTSGITYANSYCLRCNRLASQPKPKLVYWPPLLECNYDLDSDDRNTLYDLISANKGQVLQYSSERNKWLIKADKINTLTSAGTNATTSRPHLERECNITPTIPDSVEHIIRYCRAKMIDTCPSSSVLFSDFERKELERARLECQYGHQSLVYSQTSDAIYYNLACAKCNHEKQLFCEPRLRKNLQPPQSGSGQASRIVVQPAAGNNRSATEKVLWSPPGSGQQPEITIDQTLGLDSSEAARSGGRGGPHGATLIPASFSLLLDLSGAWQDNGQVGAIHQCPDAQNQVYDPFLCTCRDIVCGLHQSYMDGRCVDSGASPGEESNLNLLNITVGLKDPHISITHSSVKPSTGEEIAAAVNGSNNSSMGDSKRQQETSSSDKTAIASNSSSVSSISNPSVVPADRRRDADQTEGLESSESSAPSTPVSSTGRSLEGMATEPSTTTETAPETTISSQDSSLKPEEESEEEDEADDSPAVATIASTTLSQAKNMSAKLSSDVSSSSSTQKPLTSAIVGMQMKVESGTQLMKNDSNLGGDNSSKPVEQTMQISNNFETILASLNIAELPQATVESRHAFVECGKILILPEHYRLFTMSFVMVNNSDTLAAATTATDSTLNAKNLTSTTGSQQQEQQLKLLSLDEWQRQHIINSNQTRQQPSEGNKLWAFVLPYNLTLASSQFELVRQQSHSNGTDTQFKLLVCSPFRSDLVAKFKPAMAYVTTVCLIISITSLSMYLLLYCLSMFDLRHLVVEMAQAGSLANMLSSNPLDKLRSSRTSNELANPNGSSSAKSQSLSSRGVACLAGSLLAAYLLFILGHQQSISTSGSASEADEAPSNFSLISCTTIAAATYYCFLVAFSWMFLLSYDIWRTLRLATCQLRAPALHSQSKRFFAYTLVAMGASGLLVGSALLLDHLEPYNCQQDTTISNGTRTCSDLELELDHFIQTYKPQFGQRPGSCWFLNRRALALFFGLPVTLIMLVNLLFFLHSSYMIVRTSSRSTRRLNSSSSSSSSPPIVHKQPQFPTTIEQHHDYTQQNSLTTNSMISVQTCQSNLSTSSRSSLEEVEAKSREASQETSQTLTPEGASRLQQLHRAHSFDQDNSLDDNNNNSSNNSNRKRKLEQSQSSSSLTNQSIGGQSIATSLAMKYDTHLHNLSSMMGTIVKDYRLYCRLSTIMGLTWLTGLMASLVDQSDALWYLFVVLNTLQGLFIFIAFGCKRSKLSNLEILIHYIQMKWSCHTDSRNKSKGKRNNKSTGCKISDSDLEQGCKP